MNLKENLLFPLKISVLIYVFLTINGKFYKRQLHPPLPKFFHLFLSHYLLNLIGTLKPFFFTQFLSIEIKTTLKPCAISSVNLPFTSAYSLDTVAKSRESAFKITKKKIEAVTTKITNVCYQSSEEFVKRALNLKLPFDWSINKKMIQFM